MSLEVRPTLLHAFVQPDAVPAAAAVVDICGRPISIVPDSVGPIARTAFPPQPTVSPDAFN